MRGLLAAVFVASACSHSVATTPAVPREADPAADPLAFLPADSELVVELRFRVLAASQAWHELGPAITSALQKTLSSRAWADCVWGKTDRLDRTTVAFKGQRTIGVVRTLAASETFACLQRELPGDGAKIVSDRGVVVAYFGRAAMAFALVGPNAIVFDVDRTAGHDSVSAVVASGAPLRAVLRFVDKHRVVPDDAAAWMISNGSSPMIDALGAHALDATVFLSDHLYAEGHLETASVEASNQLAATLREQAVPARQFFDALQITAEGPVVKIHATTARLDTLLHVLLP